MSPMSPSLCIPKYSTRPQDTACGGCPWIPWSSSRSFFSSGSKRMSWFLGYWRDSWHDRGSTARQLECYRTLSSGMLETSGNNSWAQIFQENLPCLHFWSLLHIKLKTLYIFLEVSRLWWLRCCAKPPEFGILWPHFGRQELHIQNTTGAAHLHLNHLTTKHDEVPMKYTK